MANNSPPSSLASLLAYPNVGGGVGNESHPGHDDHDANDASALIDYVVGNYDTSLVHQDAIEDHAPLSSNIANADPGPSPFQPQPASSEHTPASVAIDTSHVHPTLLRLGASALEHRPSGLSLPASLTSSLETSGAGDLWTGERGEMGGKRRKAPHERAGWKEMEQAKSVPKRSKTGHGHTLASGLIGDGMGSVSAAGSSFTVPGVAEGSAGKDDLHGQEGSAAEALMGFDTSFDSSLAELGAAEGADSVDLGNSGAGASRGRGKMTKDARAEQNRKAQQVFRRKREEKMKQLEIDAAATQAARSALWELEQRAQAILLELEAKEVEIAAMRTSMLLISKANKMPILDESHSVVLDLNNYFPGAWGKVEDNSRVQSTTTDEMAYEAFERLAQHSRDVARANRQKREQEGEVEEVVGSGSA